MNSTDLEPLCRDSAGRYNLDKSTRLLLLCALRDGYVTDKTRLKLLCKFMPRGFTDTEK